MKRRKPSRLGRTRDDRGRFVKMIDPIPPYMRRRYDVIDAEALERIAQALEPGVRMRRRLSFLPFLNPVATLALIIAGFAIADSLAAADIIGSLANPGVLVAIVGGLLVPGIITRQERLTRVRSVMLRHRRCPHCGYGLDGLPVCADDGATVCPECACAWTLEEDPAGIADSRPHVTPLGQTLKTLLLMGLVFGIAILISLLYV